jgi:predicted RNase H-like HicB family nuclease
MIKLEVTVCKTGTGYSAHIEEIPGIITTGSSFDELKTNMYKALESHIQVLKEDGDEIPELLKEEYRLIFQMDVESLLEFYRGILSQTGLSKYTGINIKQLNHYATGESKPRPNQIRKIEQGLHKLGQELLQIQL